MAVLKRIKFGSTSTPIAMTKVAINDDSKKVLSVVGTNNTEDVNDDPLYTIALAVDGKTITKTGDNGLATALALKVETASGEKKARIALVDSKGAEGYAELSSVNIEDIVGNGVISSTSYDEATGFLTITWAGGSTTEVNLDALLDINDIVVADGSKDFLSFTLADPAAETGQAVIGVKLADVAYNAENGLTVNTDSGKILDASDAIPAIKAYVDGAIDIEAARSDAKNKADIAALDVDAVGGADGDVLTQISETDGKINATKSSLTNVKLAGYAANPNNKGAIAATDTVAAALNKIENTLASTTVKYNVVGTTLVVANVTIDESLTV